MLSARFLRKKSMRSRLILCLFHAWNHIIVEAHQNCLFVCLFVGLVERPANSSMSSFQTAQGHAFRKMFYATGAVTASMR